MIKINIGARQGLRLLDQSATTELNHNGKRTWFICPRCSGSKAKLFLRNGRFACSTCQRLRYQSKPRPDGAQSMGVQLRTKETDRQSENKPKGMH